MRKCVNTISFINPVYTCKEAKRNVMLQNHLDMFYKRAESSQLLILQWNLLRRTSHKTDTSLRRTISLVPAELVSFSQKTLYKTDICKTDTSLRWTLWPVPRGVRLKKVLLYFLFLSFKAHALMAQSNQNIRMKMGVADIRLVHSIRKHCG